MKSFHLRGPLRMTIRNNVIGNYDYNDYATSNTVGTYGGQQSAEDIVIEDNVFENIDRNGAPDHTECLFIQSIDGLIIDGNRLRGVSGDGSVLLRFRNCWWARTSRTTFCSRTISFLLR